MPAAMTTSDEGTSPAVSPQFGRVEWDADDSRSGVGLTHRGRTLLATLLVVGSVALYDYAVVPAETPLVAEYDPPAIDFLFAVSLVVFGLYVVAPLVRDSTRRTEMWETVRDSRAATASLAYLLVFFVGGLVGPSVLDTSLPDLRHASQPPAFTTVNDFIIGNCVGPVVDGMCRGTLQFPVGTDTFGHSMVLVTVQGMRVALQVALVSATIIVPIAAAVGVAAGYFGGRVDELLMRYVDVQQTVPALVMYFIVIFLWGRNLFVIVLVFGLLGWGGVARVVRGEVMGLRSEPYVRAARGAGASHVEVIRRHVLPNVVDTLLVSTAQQIPYLLLVEASLSFMKLNAIELPSWGESIRWGMGEYFPMFWWISTWPLLCLVATVVAFGVLGDTLQDAVDPRV
jgi:peptide/nickel transport system permease protein